MLLKQGSTLKWLCVDTINSLSDVEVSSTLIDSAGEEHSLIVTVPDPEGNKYTLTLDNTANVSIGNAKVDIRYIKSNQIHYSDTFTLEVVEAVTK